MAKQTNLQENQTWMKLKKQKVQSKKEHIKLIDQFIEKNKDKEIVFSAYMFKAKLLLQIQKPKSACLIYYKIVKSPFHYKNGIEAYQKSARCLFKEGKIKKAIQVLEDFIQNPKESVVKKKQLAQMQWSFLKNKKDLIDLKLVNLSHLIAFSTKIEQKKYWFNISKKLIDSLKISDLVIYANQADFFGRLAPYLLYKAGQYFLKNKKFSKAEKYFKKSLATSLDPNLRKEVKQTLYLMKKISKVNPYLLGVIVPLSGRRKSLGEKILKGLYLGLSIDKDSPWQMVILDSQSHPEVVRTHINDLFYNYNVMGLIGGLTGDTAEVMAQKAEEFFLPTVVLSQKRELTKDRSFVFQNAITAQDLLDSLIKEIRQNLKMNQVAILYPDDSYGKDYATLFSKLFIKKGGKIVAKEIYKPGEVDFKNSVQKLLQLNLDKRMEEFEKLKAELLQKKDISTRSLKLTPENILPVQKEFSAVFIPDSLISLQKIKDHFKYYGVKDIYFLGTNLWKGLNPKRQEFSFIFVDVPKKQDKDIKSNFYKSFIKSYAYSPGHFEQRAYNTALFFKQALDKNINTRFLLQKELKSINQFDGAYYPLTISKDQIFKYPVEVYKIIPK